MWRATTFLDQGWPTNCFKINSFSDQAWAKHVEQRSAAFMRFHSERERHSWRQKTCRGRYWLLHLLLTPSIHAAQYTQIQHIPTEHFCFSASRSPSLAQSKPEVMLCCSQKTLFRDRQFCTQYFVNICEKRCTKKLCILFYGSLQACFDEPLILTQLLIHSCSGANGDLQWSLSGHLKV